MNVLEELNLCGLTSEQYQECIQLIIDKKNGNVDIDWSEICQKYNLQISPDNLRRVCSTIFGGAFVAEFYANENIAKKKRTVAEEIANYGRDISYHKDGTTSSSMLIEMTENQSKDPEYVLKAHGFDNSKWKVSNYRNTVRQVISKVISKESEKGKPVYDSDVKTLYASFITVKPIEDRDLSLQKISEFFDNLDRNYSVPQIQDNYSYLEGDKLLLIDISDLHMNLQASMFTTGNEYNCKIAEKLFFYVIEDIVTRTKQYSFNEIVFVIGGDMLNADSITGTTTKGTPQNNDVFYYDACEKLYAMTIKAIDILKNFAPVNVIYCMGNHDEVTGYKLAKYIDAWFRNDDKVFVDYSPMARKYKLFGNTLMCFAHDGKVQTLPALIADEARAYWAQAETVEVFLQHLHTEKVLLEDNNIRIQRLPTISGRSKWSSDKGYSSKRQCKTFIFDKENGLSEVLYTPIRKNMLM